MLHSYTLQNVVLTKCVYGELNEYASFLRIIKCSVIKTMYGELNEYASFVRVTECSLSKMCIWKVKRICFILAHYKM